MKTAGQGSVANAAVDVGGQVVQDLQRQVSQRLLGPLDELAWVGLCKRNSQRFTDLLPDRLFRGLQDLTVVCLFGEGVEVTNQACQIFVADIRLETQLMFEGDGKGKDEVEGRPTNVSICILDFVTRAAYSFASRSSFPSSPSRSAVFTQIVRARLREVWISSAQYLRPSAHLPCC